jgi:predicted anti-sigma-YlaC factor YlaD
MFLCKFVYFWFSVFPFKPWQDFLVRAHIHECPACQARLASLDKVKALLMHESDVLSSRDLWPDVKSAIIKKKPEKRTFLAGYPRWAFAAAGLMAILVAGFLFYTVLVQSGGLTEQEEGARFQINYLRVGNESATPYLYQPKDSDMIIVWAEKSP